MRNDLTAVTGGAAAYPTPQTYDFPGPVEEISTKGIRKLIADRMLQSLRNHAQLTLNASADARAFQSFRRKLKESPETLGLGGITLNDFVLYAVSRTLPAYRELNAHWAGDKILRFARVHLGFAVDTPRGLMVPVIRNADLLSLKAISAEAKRLAKACTGGGITPDELAGGTFTISNLGALGIESFTPVLNTPQVAILGVCSVTPKPVMTDGKVEFIPSIGLSLTIDHQAVDGAPGARFLKDLTEAIAGFDILLAKG
jgi:pyruvate dehydrogenase E2 component (dihydrolipoamide acetyltransferase)